MKTGWLFLFCGIGNVLSFLWIAAAILSRRRFFDILRAADPTLFPLARMLKPGFAVFGRLRVSPGKIVRYFSGRKGVPPMDAFGAYCAESWAFGAAVPVLALTFLLAAAVRTPELIWFGGGIAICTAAYPVYMYRERQKKRREAMEREMPAVISKTVLLNNAGMTLEEAWNTVAESAEGAVYTEMRRAGERMKNGKPADEALLLFAEACGVRDARQFAGILSRQKTKGGNDISAALRFLNSESWENRKQRAKLRGQAASEALLLPMLMIFLGILAMVIVPIFTEINFY